MESIRKQSISFFYAYRKPKQSVNAVVKHLKYMYAGCPNFLCCLSVHINAAYKNFL